VSEVEGVPSYYVEVWQVTLRRIGDLQGWYRSPDEDLNLFV
jgi:hypothetical protein